jgi:hypothetical protein
MDVHEVFVAKGLHANGAFALPSLDTVVDAFLANNMTADGDGGVFETAVADTVCDLLLHLSVWSMSRP